jgi:hypothetical protein
MAAKLNPVLNGVLRKYMNAAQAGLAGLRLSPLFNTGIQAASYYVLDKATLLERPTNLRRAPGAPHAELPPTKLSTDTYNCLNYALKGGVPDELRAFYASSFDADRVKIEQVGEVQQLAREIRIRDIATGGSVPSSSPGTKWNANGSKPRADVITAKSAINNNSVGFEANTLVLAREVADVLIDHADVKENVKYVTGGNLTYDQLRQYFQIENLVIAGAFENTAADGQAATAGRIWGDSVLLAYVNPRAGSDWEVPTFMRSMRWSAVGTMESWRDSDRKTDFHSADEYLDEKLTGADLGYHLSNVLN